MIWSPGTFLFWVTYIVLLAQWGKKNITLLSYVWKKHSWNWTIDTYVTYKVDIMKFFVKKLWEQNSAIFTLCLRFSTFNTIWENVFRNFYNGSSWLRYRYPSVMIHSRPEINRTIWFHVIFAKKKKYRWVKSRNFHTLYT